MSSTSLSPITAELPLDPRSQKRLEKLVQEATQRHLTLTFEQVLRRVDSIPPEVLSMVLAQLVDLGLAKRVIRVESPTTKVGLGDYDSLEKVPRRLLDHSANQEIDVTPDDLRVLYKF